MHNLSKALCKFFTLKGQCHKICHPFSVKKLPWPLVNRPILYDFENEKLFPYPPNITNLLECIFIKLVSEEGRFSKFVEN